MHINITYSFLTYYVVMIHYHWPKVVGFLEEQNTRKSYEKNSIAYSFKILNL